MSREPGRKDPSPQKLLNLNVEELEKTVPGASEMLSSPIDLLDLNKSLVSIHPFFVSRDYKGYKASGLERVREYVHDFIGDAEGLTVTGKELVEYIVQKFKEEMTKGGGEIRYNGRALWRTLWVALEHAWPLTKAPSVGAQVYHDLSHAIMVQALDAERPPSTPE